MKNNTIKKIALTGLLGIGMALQASQTPTGWKSYLPTSMPGKSYLPNIDFSKFKLPAVGFAKYKVLCLTHPIIPFSIAAITGLGIFYGYKKYRSYKSMAMEKEQSDKLRMLQALKNTGFVNTDAISSPCQQKYAAFLTSALASPEAVETRKRNDLWKTIETAMNIQGDRFKIVNFLQDRQNKDEISFYIDHQKSFDTLIAAKKRIVNKKRQYQAQAYIRNFGVQPDPSLTIADIREANESAEQLNDVE